MAQLVKNLPVMWERPGFDPWVGKIPWRRESYPLQYSGLKNPMDCIVHEVTEHLHVQDSGLCAVRWGKETGSAPSVSS